MNNNSEKPPLEEIQELKEEIRELLNSAQEEFLLLEKDHSLSSHYSAIFRSFHSIKGAAGMFSLKELEAHMHQIEHQFQLYKSYNSLNHNELSYFLKAIDQTHNLLADHFTEFDYNVLQIPPKEVIKNNPSSLSINPYQTNHTETKPVEKNTKDLTQKSKNTPLIMLVDDEPDILEINKDLISSEIDCTILTYTNPSELLADFINKKPALIVSDYKMPEMNGLELLKK
jgi:chemotaxis protein histidine kinase CheA